MTFRLADKQQYHYSLDIDYFFIASIAKETEEIKQYMLEPLQPSHIILSADPVGERAM